MSNNLYAWNAAPAVGRVFLEGAADSRNEAKNAEWTRFQAETAQERDAGRMTSVQRAKILKQKHQELFGAPDSYDDEYWTFFEYIAYRRDTQGLSPQEASYLVTNKRNELDARKANESRTTSNSLPRKKLDYQCKQDCVSKNYSWDFCDSKCSY